MQEITVPTGNTKADFDARKKIIYDFYQQWKIKYPLQKKYNLHLKEYINIRYISIDETSNRAALNYRSTLAVLQLDSILTGAKKVATVNAKAGDKNQKMFEKMIIMEYQLVGIGNVKMTVGVRRRTKEKIQYCITALESK